MRSQIGCAKIETAAKEGIGSKIDLPEDKNTPKYFNKPRTLRSLINVETPIFSKTNKRGGL